MNDKTLNKILGILIVGIIFVLIAPFLFTRPLGLIDFSKTGTIGDTIGGITAPITSLLGSILVFFALKAQIDANKLIQNQIENQEENEIKRKKVQYLSEQVNLVRNDINEFSYTYIDERPETTEKSYNIKRQKFNYLGFDAINEFLESLRDTPEIPGTRVYTIYPKLKELYNLLEIIKSLFIKIENADISIEDKHFFKTLLGYQYNSKVLPAFTANKRFRFSIQKQINARDPRGIPDEIYQLIDQINDFNNEDRIN